jgi:hypothetical protein
MFIKFPLELSENQNGKKQIKFIGKSQKWISLKKSVKITKSYGVRTGFINKESSYILLDFDNKPFQNEIYNGIELMNILIEKGILTVNNDYIQKTGNNGYHYVFKISKEQVNALQSSKTNIDFEGSTYSADIKANNQFFIGAGSEYNDKNGNIKKYSLVCDKIREIPKELYEIFENNMIKKINKIKKNIVKSYSKIRKSYNCISLYNVDKLLKMLDIGRAGNYDSWFSVLVAVYGANSEAKKLFVDWSKSHPKYKNESEQDIITHWENYSEKQHNIGMLKNMAKKDNCREYIKLMKGDKTLIENVKNDNNVYFMDSKYICNKDYTFSNNIEAQLQEQNEHDKLMRKIASNFINNENSILGVKSNMGTGKTVLIREMIENNQSTFKKILMISTRRSFCRSVGGTFTHLGFKQYLDENINSENSDRVICSLESLEKFIGSDVNIEYDLIILDEVESVIKQLDSPYIKNSYLTLNFFKRMLKQSKRILACDADFNNCAHTFMNSLKKDYKLMINEYSDADNCRKIIINNNDSIINKKIDECMTENKNIVIVAMSNRKAQEIKLSLKSTYPDKKIICHTGESDHRERELLKDVNKNWLDCNILIYTSTVGAGIDFNKSHFSNMFCYISGKSNSPRMLLQMMGRIRKLEDNNIYTVADTRTINLDLSKGDRYTYEDIEEIYKLRYGENIDEIFIYNKQEQLNKGLYSFIPEFEQCLKSSGYEFELIDAEIAISKVWSIDNEEFLKLGSLVDVPIIDEETFKLFQSAEFKHKKNIDHIRMEQKFIFMKRFSILKYDEEIEKAFNSGKISSHYILNNIKYMTDKNNMKIDQKRTIKQTETIDRCKMINTIINGLGFKNCWDFETEYNKEQYEENINEFLKSPFGEIDKTHFNIMFGREKGKMLLNSESVYKDKSGNWNPLTLPKKIQWINKLLENYGLKIQSNRKREGKNRVMIYKLSSFKNAHEFIVNKKIIGEKINDYKKIIPSEQSTHKWENYF